MKEFPQLDFNKIDNLTLEQLNLMLHKIGVYREYVAYADVTLVELKQVLFEVFSVKVVEKNPQVFVQKDSAVPEYHTSFQTVQMTEEEILAYEKAGMPSPLKKWLFSFRKRVKK